MKYIIAILVMFFSCKDDDSILFDGIIKVEKTRKISKDLFVINKFPQLKLETINDSISASFNWYLENVNGLYTIKDSSAFSFKGENKKIIGDFDILVNNDSLVIFEFFLSKGGLITSYKPVFFHKYDNSFKECDDFKWKFSRDKLKKYIVDYKNKFNVNINEYAYQSGSNTKLSYALVGEQLIIYAGDEGEFGGKYKIVVPYNSVKTLSN